MKRTVTLFAAFLLLAVGATAQKLSYQAVVRNNANELMTETTVQVAVSVLNANNVVQYAETHANVQTNRNGLLSLMIGEGTPTSSTTLADVVWVSASVRTVITLPNNSTITSVTPVNSVPYALYADNVNPSMVSNAIANYIANHNIGGENNVQSDWNETDPNSDAYIHNKPTLFDGDYNSLSNKPNIPTVPTNVSEFNNDAEYVTTTQLNAANYITAADIPAQVNADWDATSGAAQILNKPTIPAPANDAILNIKRNSIQIGTFSADATENTTVNIAVPTSTSELNNDAHFVTQDQLTEWMTNMNSRLNNLQNNMYRLQYQHDTINFQCGTSTVTDYDGNVYNTVKIGRQCWLAENLRSTHYTDGVEIPENTRFYPNNDANNVAMYGYLYRWEAIMHGAEPCNSNPSNVQGICPKGWHVTSLPEWAELFSYVDTATFNGTPNGYRCENGNNNRRINALCKGVWNDVIECGPGDNTKETYNATGLGVLPAGCLYGYYHELFGKRADFATCSDLGNGRYHIYIGEYGGDQVCTAYPNSSRVGSVRCIKDENPQESGENTTAQQPTVTTTAASNITINSAVLQGEISNPDFTPVVSQGFQLKETTNSSYATILSSGMSMSHSATNLTPGTSYTYRAFVTTMDGTAYGQEETFSTQALNSYTHPCPDAPTVTDYDGNVYHTVQIGSQCWMAENLRSIHYADGDAIPAGSESSNTEAYRYFPGNDISNVAVYGYLYNWPATMHGESSSSNNPSGVRGICPNGWHVPSDAEWTQLTGYLSSQSQYVCGDTNINIAKALASSVLWNSSSTPCAVGNEPNSNNSTGFGALPAGHLGNGSFGGKQTHFWSSTYSRYGAWCRLIQNGNPAIVRTDWYYGGSPESGMSVRCLRD